MGTYDPMPLDGNTNWGNWFRATVGGVDSRLLSLEATIVAGWPGYALLSEFSGADSTAKLRTAMATLANEAAGNRRALIIPPNTQLSGTGPTGSAPIPWGTGVTIVGGPIPNTEFSYQHRVQITSPFPSGLFVHNSGALTRAANMLGIAWEGPGGGSTDFLVSNTADQLQYSTWQNCSFDNWNRVFDRKVLGFAWTGPGYCNNSTETPIRIQGSDWELFNSGRYFIDSPNLSATKFCIDVVTANKAIIGPIFNTGNLQTPLRVQNGQRLTINMSEMESLADGSVWPSGPASAGAQLLVNGGNVVAIHPWFFRGLANPSATGRTPQDNGIVQVNGGLLRMIAPTFGEYNSSESHTENHVMCTGGRVEMIAPKVWNLQANSGVGGVSARALTTAKSGSGTIATTTLTEL